MSYAIVKQGFTIQRRRKDGTWVPCEPRRLWANPAIYRHHETAEKIVAASRHPERLRIVSATLMESA